MCVCVWRCTQEKQKNKKNKGSHTKYERARDGTVALLTSCIPSLCFDGLSVHLNATSGELDTDCALGLEAELTAGETRKQITLAYTAEGGQRRK
jgi:hypothetical protein